MLTEFEQTVLDSYLKTGNKTETARKLGITRNAVRGAIGRIEHKGEAPWLSRAPLPEHMALQKSTVMYNAAGEVEREWRRLIPTAEAMKEFVEGLCDKVKGVAKVKARKPKKGDGEEILFEIDIFDPHVGLYADERETLDSNYDCDIAAKRMVEAVEDLASRSTRPKKCVLVFGGDSTHQDGFQAKTEHSGNLLDADTRYQRVIQYLIKASRECVSIAASIAESVEIVVLKGNHSRVTDCWLAQVLNAYYCECPNITVQIEHSPRSKMVWGDNLIVWAHGDRVPANKWPMIIAAEFSKDWGQTKHRYLRCGHIHSQKTIAPVIVQEQSGIIVEFCPALCAADSWHSDSGYVGNQRGASAVEYHKKKGRITSLFHVV